MRSHSHEEQESLRPKAARLVHEPDPHVLDAAATGRMDVIGAAGMLDLQRAVGNSGVSAMLEEDRSPVHDVVGSGGGSPMAPELRSEMEARLGHDFSDVRVHTDSAADASARSVQAHAYTVGSDVVFQRGMYDPSSNEGKKMLAHELTHVTQQRAGEVDGSPAAGGIRVSDPSDRFERAAVENADRAMSAPVPAGAAAVQRDETGEEVAQRAFDPEAGVEEETEEGVDDWS
jgi:hypothetical protein